MQVRTCKIRPDFSRFENPMAQVIRFLVQKSDDLGHQIFKSKNGKVSKFKMLSTRASNSSNSLSYCEKQNTKTGRLYVERTQHVFSSPGQRQSAWVRTIGSYAECSALGASLRGARPQQQQLVSAFVGISASIINPICSHRKTVSICEDHS